MAQNSWDPQWFQEPLTMHANKDPEVTRGRIPPFALCAVAWVLWTHSHHTLAHTGGWHCMAEASLTSSTCRERLRAGFELAWPRKPAGQTGDPGILYPTLPWFRHTQMFTLHKSHTAPPPQKGRRQTLCWTRDSRYTVTLEMWQKVGLTLVIQLAFQTQNT